MISQINIWNEKLMQVMVLIYMTKIFTIKLFILVILVWEVNY